MSVLEPDLQTTAGPDVPGHDCPLCPRLVAFRTDNQAGHPDSFNAPVPTFGTRDASLLIVGLAPGLRGAERTGRPSPGIMPAICATQARRQADNQEAAHRARPNVGTGALNQSGCPA